jgi:hypothetical protein
MIIFFCAGIFSEMADAKPQAEDPRLDSSTDEEEDGPDARLRRRERREAKKNVVADESVLDETEDEEDGGGTPMEQGSGENYTPAPQGDSMATDQQPEPVTAPAAPETMPAPVNPVNAAAVPDATAGGSATQSSGTNSEKKTEIEKNNALLKKPIETLMFNISTEANQSGANVQLSPKTANRTGAVGGGGQTLAVATS